MWQTLETKARFIQQVMSGQSAVRSAEDLEGGALTYAEIKAIASGNPAVMEKVRIDTEMRKLDQLHAVHLNQQHKIRWELRHLPSRVRKKGLSAACSLTLISPGGREVKEAAGFYSGCGTSVTSLVRKSLFSAPCYGHR